MKLMEKTILREFIKTNTRTRRKNPPDVGNAGFTQGGFLPQAARSPVTGVAKDTYMKCLEKM